MKPLICFCSFQHVLDLPAQPAKACSPVPSSHSFYLLPHPSQWGGGGLGGVLHCPTLSTFFLALTLPLPAVSSSLSREAVSTVHSPGLPLQFPHFSSTLHPSSSLSGLDLLSISFHHFPLLSLARLFPPGRSSLLSARFSRWGRLPLPHLHYLPACHCFHGPDNSMLDAPLFALEL